VVLFLLTCVSMLLAGGPGLMVGGMAIMLAHEFGHYFACRYYGIDATLPFFIPVPPLPLPSLVGTLGAFIRIKSPIPHRRALFDVGIAGPLMGFVVALPVLVFGYFDATFAPEVAFDPGRGVMLGDPLLIKAMTRIFMGPTPEGMTVSIGGLGLAGWFGMVLTGLNLLPIGQLDGGHVVYALLREKAAVVSRVGFWACLGLVYFGPSWLVWAILLWFLGRRHPPTLDDEAPVGRGRVLVALLGLVVFVLSFVPDPFPGAWDLVRGAFLSR
jgi:membrane-associated protease RseP (regulator of RpoE activity)